MKSFHFNRRRTIVAIAILVYVSALAFTWLLSTKRAWHQTESMLDYAMLDLNDTLNGSLDTMLLHIAVSILEDLGSAKPISNEDALRILAERRIDELNVLDRTGRNLGSSDSRLIGTSMADTPKSAEFLVLTKGEVRAYSQPFRTGGHNPDVCRKYLGLAFPDGDGFIQVGIDESHVTTMFPSIMGFIFDEWLLGEKGFFLCANIDDGRLISNPARHRDEAHFLEETGYDPNGFNVYEDGKRTFNQRLFGETCNCRAIIFAGHRIIAALPPAEYFRTRTVYTTGLAVLLAIILSLFVVLLCRINADSMRIQAFYASEVEKHAAELELGRTIQMAALPTAFTMNEYCRLAAFIEPAQEVGGDFYDFFSLDETHLAFLVADVSGKGITGALYMMNAKTIIKNVLMATTTYDPAEALSQVNAELCRNNPAEMFVTAWVGVLDIDTGYVSFVNAGHNPPILRHSTGETEWLKARSGCPLGCFENATYKVRDMLLKPGDMIFLYTDGVTEAMNVSGELFGDERLIATLGDGKQLAENAGPSEVCAAVRSSVERFVEKAPQADDLTLLTVQYLCIPERYVRPFPAQDVALVEAPSFVEEKLRAVLCPNKTRGQILIALDEVLSNVVRCSGASGITVSLTFSHARQSLTMAISDDGKPFNPLHVPPPDTTLPPEKRPIGGLGILRLQKTMDKLAYRYVHGCNILTLCKTIVANS